MNHIHDLITSEKPHFLIPSTSALGFQHMDFGETLSREIDWDTVSAAIEKIRAKAVSFLERI